MSIRKSDAPDIFLELAFGLLWSSWQQSQKSVRDGDMSIGVELAVWGILMLKVREVESEIVNMCPQPNFRTAFHVFEFRSFSMGSVSPDIEMVADPGQVGGPSRSTY
jgi:hypothetical protein